MSNSINNQNASSTNTQASTNSQTGQTTSTRWNNRDVTATTQRPMVGNSNRFDRASHLHFNRSSQRQYEMLMGSQRYQTPQVFSTQAPLHNQTWQNTSAPWNNRGVTRPMVEQHRAYSVQNSHMLMTYQRQPTPQVFDTQALPNNQKKKNTSAPWNNRGITTKNKRYSTHQEIAVSEQQRTGYQSHEQNQGIQSMAVHEIPYSAILSKALINSPEQNNIIFMDTFIKVIFTKYPSIKTIFFSQSDKTKEIIIDLLPNDQKINKTKITSVDNLLKTVILSELLIDKNNAGMNLVVEISDDDDDNKNLRDIWQDFRSKDAESIDDPNTECLNTEDPDIEDMDTEYTDAEDPKDVIDAIAAFDSFGIDYKNSFMIKCIFQAKEINKKSELRSCFITFPYEKYKTIYNNDGCNTLAKTVTILLVDIDFTKSFIIFNAKHPDAFNQKNNCYITGYEVLKNKFYLSFFDIIIPLAISDFFNPVTNHVSTKQLENEIRSFFVDESKKIADFNGMDPTKGAIFILTMLFTNIESSYENFKENDISNEQSRCLEELPNIIDLNYL